MLATLNAAAQNPDEDKVRTTNFPVLKKIVNSDIPGAPILSQPQRIDGTAQEIRTEKHGLIYPAFFDWDGDGRKDLLLGEFETGETGSYIKVYLNNGTDTEPEFSGEYFYATDIKGDTITNHQWCCIGIHPRLVDIDGDGYIDILSGQYNPGLISLWRGAAEGFLPREFVEQEGYYEGAGSGTLKPGQARPKDGSPDSFNYWNYTSADFGDFNGDGLLDLFVGGSGGPRVALNVGTKENPRFGLREYLRFTDGEKMTIRYDAGYGMANIGKSYLHLVDWDGDGVDDILMTHEYSDPGHNPIEFFKGVQTADGMRFERPVPLFTAEDGSKALPGCQPMITITDYNNDGVLDIVFGISIPTINGFECAPEIAWEWAHSLGIQMPGKDAGRAIEYSGGVEGTIEKIEANPMLKSYYMGKLDDYKYLTMRHRGYLFVMYGSENPERASAVEASSVAEAANRSVEVESAKPVSYVIEIPDEVVSGEEYTAKLTITFAKGWHGYSDDEANIALGFIPTKAEFAFPEGIACGEIVCSVDSPIYEGSVSFSQRFVLPKSAANGNEEMTAIVKLQWQVCDENLCLPPEEHTVERTINLR